MVRVELTKDKGPVSSEDVILNFASRDGWRNVDAGNDQLCVPYFIFYGKFLHVVLCPKIKPLHISENGVFMLLDRIDVSKSSGPDKLPRRLLQSLTKEITRTVIHYIFTQSLCTGVLPTEWTQANVASILKKGSKLQAMNYRPVSLTCITCKLFEHIICKHILAHLEDHKILTDLQHGFRSGRSCETQLVTTFQDLAQMQNKKGSQIDIAVLDFSKAFDTVPHDGLLSKLKHYGIGEKILQWIYNFLKKQETKCCS